jgi:ketosteroid isomerase-like protein
VSSANVEIVQRALEAYSRGDLEAMLAHLDPDVEWHSAIVGGAEGNTYYGHEGFRSWFVEQFESFDELRTELSEFRDLGDRVIAFGRVHARGRESGVEIDSPTGWVFTVRRGKLARAEGFLSRERALAAAGLPE